MEKKYIHYCWFGDKPLPKLAKKCIKSWKKYLPDYEIIRWSEENVNLDECPFIKEAYAKKKWAFVADYARTKAMYEYGGIYFDTDMEVTKNIDELLKTNGGFLGVEDSHMIACGVWYEAKEHSYLATKMLEFYRSQEHFDEENIYSISIPRIISSILNDYDPSLDENQDLKHNETIYKRDYFYPYSYDFQNNIFTDNTCMIHYYDASWVPKWEQRNNKIYRMFGEKNGNKVINFLSFTKRNVKRAAKLVLYPVVLYKRRKKIITKEYIENVNNTFNDVSKLKNSSYAVFVNPNWMGVRNATHELFDNVLYCTELYRKNDIKKIGNSIIDNNIKQIIFSGFCIGWIDLAKYLKSKNKDIKIKVFWHGNHSQVTEPYGWERNLEIIKYHKLGIIDVFATCKESLIDFYKNEGYKTLFITNSVNVNVKPNKKKNKDEFRIGLYAAKSNDWRKNMFSQLAAAKFLNYKNVVIDMVPLNNDAISFAKRIGVKIDGLDKPIPREDLIKRMGANDINLYVTFSECSPMAPIESFQVGVPCIVGNNHHCFKESKLKDYLIVNNEASPKAIAAKIKKCIDNKEEVLKLYKEWNKQNKKESKEAVKSFLEM